MSELQLIDGSADIGRLSRMDTAMLEAKAEADFDRHESLVAAKALQVSYKDIAMKSTKMQGKLGKKQPVTKQILYQMSGVFEAGRFTAIMGSSGAGKTSLLNAIAGDLNAYHGVTLDGVVRINGEIVTPKIMRKISGFVFQDEVILDTMTVREAISMSAILRLPKSVPLEDKMVRVDEAIQILHLTKAKDTQIGTPLRKGISGGERKRTGIAMEMVTNPSILFLDEPTSGLDTFTAYSVVHTLKQLAATGRTIIATIHQPSSEIYHVFDDLLLLASGRVLYHGPCQRSIDYFAERGYPCPRYTNPADYFFMDILNDVKADIANQASITKMMEGKSSNYALTAPPTENVKAPMNAISEEAVNVAHLATGELEVVVEMTDKKAVHEDAVKELLEEWPNSIEGKTMQHAVDNPVKGSNLAWRQVKSKADFSIQFGLLAHRAWKNALRNKLIVKAKFGQTLFMGLLVGLIYLQVGTGQTSIQDRQGALFFITVNGLFASTMSVVTIFGGEKQVFRREYSSGYYGLPAYFFSKLMVESPFQIIFPIIFTTIFYWLIGLQPIFYKFVLSCVIQVAMSFTGLALGTLLGASFGDLAVAMAILPAIILPLMIFGGLFVNTNSIPPYFYWIQFISPIKYGYVANSKNEFTGLTFSCPMNSTNCFATGEEILSRLGFDDKGSVGENIAILFGLCGGFLILAYCNLWRIVRKTKV